MMFKNIGPVFSEYCFALLNYREKQVIFQQLFGQ